MTAIESRGVTKLLAKIKDSMEEKKYYEGKIEQCETNVKRREKLKSKQMKYYPIVVSFSSSNVSHDLL